MIFLILLFFIVFSKPVFAAPTISITNFPETVIADEVFKITFTVSNADVGGSYHIKIMNDLDNNNVITQPVTNCSSSYDRCENINIATDSATIATASAKMNLVSGVQNLKIRIAKDTDHNLKFDSQLVSITSVLPSPTPTSVPTNTPTPTTAPTLTPTLTPTSTIKPTATPTIDLNKYTATDEATVSAFSIPSDTTIFSEEETPTNIPIQDSKSEAVLGETTANKSNFLPLFFICLGALFLLAPLIIAKIKELKCSKK